ncbi:hypothetical protein RCL1_009119 [Eukaryota sp. TZLM3-RCL]
MVFSRTQIIFCLRAFLTNSSSSFFLQHADLKLIYRCLCKFGLVSSSFRSLALEAVSHHLTQFNPEFDFFRHEHYIFKLQKLFPAHSFCLKLFVDNLQVPDIKPLRIKSIKGPDISSTSDWFVEALISVNNLDNLERLSIIIKCSTRLLEIFGTSLPCLTSLSLGLCQVDEAVVFFPCCLVKLSSLEFTQHSTRYARTYDVSNLINLRRLSCLATSGSCLVGLDCLSGLQDFELSNAVVSSGFHPQARLLQLSLTGVRTATLELLFANKNIVCECRVHLECNRVPSSLLWIYERNVDSMIVKRGGGKRGKMSVTVVPIVPYLVELDVSSAQNLVLNFGEYPLLDSFSCSSTLENMFQLSCLLYLSTLTLHKVDIPTLSLFLKRCLFLKSLSISELIGSTGDSNHCPQPFLALDYLKKLNLTDVNLSLIYFSKLPRLSVAVIEYCSGFNFSTFNDVFVNLERLIIVYSNVFGSLLCPNISLKYLQIVHDPNCVQDLPSFSLFPNLEFFTIDVDGIQDFGKLLELPLNIKSLVVSAPFKMVQSSLNTLTKLVSVSGYLYVTDELKTVAEEWLLEIKNSCSLLSCTLNLIVGD